LERMRSGEVVEIGERNGDNIGSEMRRQNRKELRVSEEESGQNRKKKESRKKEERKQKE
jgi:hypothetical protein